jgi:PAS domain S-box-containing protein
VQSELPERGLDFTLHSDVQAASAQPSTPSPWARYGLAVACVLGAVALRAALYPAVGGGLPFLTFFPAIIAAALYGGLGPGLLAVVLSTVAAALWFEPRGTLLLTRAGDGAALVLFVLVSLLIVWLCERTQRAQRLREADALTSARLAAIVESSDDAIISKSLDGIVQTWNAAAERIYGYTAAEAIGRPITMLLPPDRPDEETNILARIARGERLEHYETVRVTKDGRLIDVALTVSPVRDANGNLVGASKISRDVTEQKQAQRQLKAANEAAETEGVQRRAAEARALEESRLSETLRSIGTTLGSKLDLQELLQSVTDAATQATRAKFGAFFYNVVSDQGESYVLYVISGVPREEFSKFPMPRSTDLFGPTFRGEGTIRLGDVTKDPRYGKNAPHNGKPPGHLPVCSYLAVSVKSRSGEVIGGLFFGHPDPDVFTERDERIVEGIAAQAAVAIDNARLYEAERKARGEAEAANRQKDQLLESERAARAEAERASRMKDEFLATLSHELRTPLNAILGWAHVLRSAGTHDPQDIQHGLETIERNARAQTRIIEDLLEMSRIISGKVRLDVQHVDLGSVIHSAVETVRHAAETKGIRLQVVIDPLSSAVSGDPSRLQQVFWNLLSNSVKFSPRGARVQVLLERDNSHVEVSVIDSGEGIRADFLPHVFERFHQADASATRTHGGLGLGLSIVKQLVELHGGTVRAASPGEGLGATFTVSLPLAPLHAEPLAGVDQRDPQERDRPAASDDAHCIKLSGLKVLLVDDEPDARDLVKRVLEDCEAVVTTASSAAEAIEAVQRERPDIVLSDIGMPGEDGLTLIRKVRALGPANGGNVPAVALTAYARTEDRTRALLAGFQSHVAKPAEPDELIATIASLAGRTSIAK